jgi:peroxiredoxin Q/BCP
MLGMISDRTSYVVSQDGKIAFAYSDLDPDGHVSKTLKAVAALKR